MRARQHALNDGDQASIEALLYNKAAFRLAWLRAQRCFGELQKVELDRLRVELATARKREFEACAERRAGAPPGSEDESFRDALLTSIIPDADGTIALLTGDRLEPDLLTDC